jgi:hypothetical protein
MYNIKKIVWNRFWRELTVAGYKNNERKKDYKNLNEFDNFNHSFFFPLHIRYKKLVDHFIYKTLGIVNFKLIVFSTNKICKKSFLNYI